MTKVMGALVCAAILLLWGRAFAGVTIVSQVGARPGTTTYADGDHLRFETPPREAGGRATVVLMDAVGKRMLTLDDATKTYVEITEEDMKRMRGRMDAMRAQMDERMKAMPPEQRKMMEQMVAKRGGQMPGSDGAAKPQEWTFQAMGQKKTINGFACEMYAVNVDGKLREESCVSPWSAGLIKKDDFAGLQKFGEEMSKEFGGGNHPSAHAVFMRFDKSPGLPISRVHIDADGKRGEEEQIKSIKRGAIAPALFAIPAGYTKKELPTMPQGAPGGHRPAPHAH